MKSFKVYLNEIAFAKKADDDSAAVDYMADKILAKHKEPFVFKTDKHKYEFQNLGHAISTLEGANLMRSYLSYQTDDPNENDERISRDHAPFEKAIQDHHSQIFDNLLQSDEQFKKHHERLMAKGHNVKSGLLNVLKSSAKKFHMDKQAMWAKRNPSAYDLTLQQLSNQAKKLTGNHPMSLILTGAAHAEHAPVRKML